MKIGSIVRYVGSVDKLLQNISEREVVDEFLTKKNQFHISAVKKEGDEGFAWRKDNIEIECKLNNQTHHFFYVDIEEIELI